MFALALISTIALFTLSMRIKGGVIGKHAVIEGAYMSGLVMACFINPIFGLFWSLGNRPAMDDPAGDWKRAVQRGMFLGGCLTVGTGITHLIDPDSAINPWFIVASAGFPLYYRIGLKIDPNNWWIGELILGFALGLAAIFGSTFVTLPRW